MEKFTGKVWVLGDDIDTDIIIPTEYLALKTIDDMKQYGFSPLRPELAGQIQKGDIIVAGKNFGCGSSREHAPWALLQNGFRCVIAENFADIFYSNSLKNGLLLIVLPHDVMDRLFAACEATEGYKLTVDLDQQTVTEPDGTATHFDIAAFRRWAIMNGFDDIGITLSKRADEIRTFEEKRLAEKPWLTKTLDQ